MENPRPLARAWGKIPRWARSLASAAAFLAALDAFFVSISLLSAFKAIGSGVGQELIQELATNPLLGLLIGILVTSVVQSSSSTTSLVVSLVAAGSLGTEAETAVRVAVPVIMGANIGTSVTNILVSFGHLGDRRAFERAFAAATVHDFFNLLTVVVLLPLQAATNFLGRISLASTRVLADLGGLSFASPLKVVVRPQVGAIKGLIEHQAVATFLIATAAAAGIFFMVTTLSRRAAGGQTTRWLLLLFAVITGAATTGIAELPDLVRSSELASLIVALGGLFTALWVMVRVMRGAVLARIERLFHDYIFKTPLRALGVGIVFTALVQSSSVTTSLVVPLAAAGLLDLAQIFPYTLGANVGTTVTAMLAALSLGEPAAVAVATAHLLFNVLGIGLFYPLRRLPMTLARKLAAVSVIWPPVAPLFVVLVFFVIPLCLVFLVR